MAYGKKNVAYLVIYIEQLSLNLQFRIWPLQNFYKAAVGTCAVLPAHYIGSEHNITIIFQVTLTIRDVIFLVLTMRLYLESTILKINILRAVFFYKNDTTMQIRNYKYNKLK